MVQLEVATISSAIWSLVDDRNVISETLESTLQDIILNHTETVTTFNGFWNGANGRTILLTNFIEYIVTPHITNLLISEDLHETENGADRVRHVSMKYGMMFNGGNENDDNDNGMAGYDDEIETHNVRVCISYFFALFYQAAAL